MTPPTEQRILTLLECKQRLESESEEYVDEIHAWMAEALEALLRHQLETSREKAIEELSKGDLCREVTKEVLAVLQNHLVIPTKWVVQK